MGIIALIGGMAFGMVSPAAALSFVLGGGGLNGLNIATATAAQTVADVTSTTDTARAASSELLLENISKTITKMRPAKYMLDTIINEIGFTQSVNSWETKWYSVDTRGIGDTLKDAFSTTGTTAAVTIAVNAPHLWQKDDLMLIPSKSTGVTADGGPLVIMVTAKSGSNLTCLPINITSGIVPNIADDTPIYNIGNAKHELAASTDPYQIMPTPTSNYLQIHMAQVEESVYETMHEKEVKWDILDHKLQAIYNMRQRRELVSLFGVAGLSSGQTADTTNNVSKYTSNGIIRYIGQSLSYQAANALSDSDLIGWTKQMFVGNAGSEKRVMFVGSGLMEKMMNIPLFNRQLDAMKTEVKFGITFHLIETNFGQLLVKHHDLFNMVGYTNYGMILDFANIEKHVWKPFSTRKLDLKSPGLSNADAWVLEETFCLATRYPNTHGLISPV